MKNCLISDQTVALIGFALKSRQVVKGYEAVRRALQRNKLALVLVSSKISKNGFKEVHKNYSWKKILKEFLALYESIKSNHCYK